MIQKLLIAWCVFFGLFISKGCIANTDAVILDIGGPVHPDRFSTQYFTQSASPDRFRFVPDPMDSSRTVLELTFRNGDPKAAGGWRTEIVAKGDMLKSGTRWYGFEFFVPSNWKVTSKPIVVSQIHGNDNLYLIPVLSLGISGTKMYLMLGSNINLIGSVTPPRSDNTVRVSAWEAPLTPGRWYRLIVRADWSFEPGKGAIDIWIDDKIVYSAHRTPNAYDTSGGANAGNYAKMGLYAWEGLGSVDQQYILVRGIVFGQASARYRDIVNALAAK